MKTYQISIIDDKKTIILMEMTEEEHEFLCRLKNKIDQEAYRQTMITHPTFVHHCYPYMEIGIPKWTCECDTCKDYRAKR